MYTTQDWNAAVTRLIERTSKGQYKWQLTQAFQEEPLEDTDKAFELEIGGNRYVVRSARSREYYDSEPSDYTWSSKYVVLEVYRVADDGRPVRVATSPNLDAIKDLFKKVEGGYAYDQGILTDLLNPNIFD